MSLSLDAFPSYSSPQRFTYLLILYNITSIFKKSSPDSAATLYFLFTPLYQNEITEK